MKQSIAAAAAALSAIFAISTDVQAQARTPCGPTAQLTEGLARYGEKMTAIGSLQNVDGMFEQKLKAFLRSQPESAWLHIQANKETGSWTAVVTTNENISCVLLSGDALEIQSDYSRSPGIPVSMPKWETPLQKFEYQLTWGKDGGQGLQLKGTSPMGELRLYANTATGSFTAILHNPATGDIMPLAQGDNFPALEIVAASVKKQEEQKMARTLPAPEAIPGPEATPH